MTQNTIALSVDDGIARVTLSRPDVRNAFNADVIAELSDVFTRIAAADDVRAVVLAGEGKVFCGGADINWMRASLDLSFEANAIDAERMSDMFRAIDNCTRPVIGRIHGAALGGGAGLAAVCDVAIAADDAVFGFTEVKLGIIPAVISPFVLSKIGASHARALFLTGERFGAERAKTIGLVHEVVPEAQLDGTVDRVLGELAERRPAGDRRREAVDPQRARFDVPRDARAHVAGDRQAAHRRGSARRPARVSGAAQSVVRARMIRRLLIANRGEIAVRVARGARELGIVPLGIYSEADAGAYHLRFVDDARCVGAAPAAESYLDIDAVIAAAASMQADAVHPGYGFLSERAAFARAVRDAGMTFVGPSPEAMAAMGSKIEAKRRVREFDVPVVPGYDGDDRTLEALRAQAGRVGFPLLIKASAGGGGRGMRVVESLDAFDEALAAAQREALAAFGDDAVLLERYLRDPRHIEFQVLADAHGTTIHLGERECSIQRRHQKIVEEAPSVALSPELRATMGAAAVRAAQSVGYVNAGTCEFMLDASGEFYFLEMNTRLQVEHPVTELVYGVDLVQWQLRIANGERLTISQADVRPRGWAIEGRIYAEDPANHLLPSIGTITHWAPPEGPGVRLDSGVDTGSEVSVYYDPMLAKLIVFGSDRAHAVARFERALEDFTIDGVRSNVPLLLWIARDDAFRAGETTTSFLAQRLDESIFSKHELPREATLLCAAAMLVDGAAPWRIGGVGMPLRLQHDGALADLVADATPKPSTWRLSGTYDGELTAERRGDRVHARFGDASFAGTVARSGGDVHVHLDGRWYRFAFAPPPDARGAADAHGGGGDGRITSPMPGKIVKIAVEEGAQVEEHALLLVLEAMKMEHRIEASVAATVKRILVKEGDIVPGGTPLVELG